MLELNQTYQRIYSKGGFKQLNYSFGPIQNTQIEIRLNRNKKSHFVNYTEKMVYTPVFSNEL